MRTRYVSPRGHRLGRARAASSMGGDLAECECGEKYWSHPMGGRTIAQQHVDHLKKLGLSKVPKEEQ